MNTEYYLSKRQGTDDFHSIHKEGCPFLDNIEKNIFLGNFRSSADALSEGQKHFAKSKNCKFCSKNEKNKKHEFGVGVLFEQMLAFEQQHSNNVFSRQLFCCVN